MNELFVRDIYYYKDYYLDFFEALKPDVKRKFNWTLKLLATIDRVPVKYFKHLEGTTGLFEVRVEVGSNIYRVFSFFDEGRLIILLNGFQKKSQRTPKNEIELAEKLDQIVVFPRPQPETQVHPHRRHPQWPSPGARLLSHAPPASGPACAGRARWTSPDPPAHKLCR